MLNKLSMYHLDYEAQYQYTTDFVTNTFINDFNGIKKYWLCLPISAQCCCNMNSGTWITWDKDKKNIWCREIPKNEYVINEDNVKFEFKKGDIDYSVQDTFTKWFEKENGKTATVIGIRADESLNRYRAIVKENPNKYKNTNFINNHNAYPIYDWSVEDIWIYNSKYKKEYNKLYDLYYQAGLKIDQMRVASPFNNCAADTLKMYKVIEPQTWGKLVSRVNGVNFTGIYGGTTAMGWKSIKLPKDHTWKSYLNFLLNTLDENTKNHYIEKFNTSIKFWKEKGGALTEETIEELNGIGEVSTPNNYSNKRTVKFNEYPDDLDVTNFREVPSYKRMCICILKNDYYCKYMGFAQTKQEKEKRLKAIEKYKNL